MATPNMNLTLPTPTVTLGPAWATELNTAIETVDTHDHSTGKGVRVKPDGLNINTDLDVQTNNINNVLSTRLAEQASLPVGAQDIRSLYSYQGNLYYNNATGDTIRITSGTSIDASTVGGIGGDYGSTPAVVNYVNASKTYFFETDTNRRGAIDSGALIIRETDVVNSNAVTLRAPAALAANYTATLPGATPPATRFLSMSNTGAMDFINADESTVEITGGNTLQVKAGGITEVRLGTDSVTAPKIAALNVTTAKIAGLAVTKDKLAATSVSGDKLDLIVVQTSLTPGSDSAVINIPNQFTHGYFSFIGDNAYLYSLDGVSFQWTWSGPATPIISRGEVSRTGTAQKELPASMFSLSMAGGAAGNYALTFVLLSGFNNLLFQGGIIQFVGFRAS